MAVGRHFHPRCGHDILHLRGAFQSERLNPREVQLFLAGQALSLNYPLPNTSFREKSGLVLCGAAGHARSPSPCAGSYLLEWIQCPHSAAWTGLSTARCKLRRRQRIGPPPLRGDGPIRACTGFRYQLPRLLGGDLISRLRRASMRQHSSGHPRGGSPSRRRPTGIPLMRAYFVATAKALKGVTCINTGARY